MVSSMIDKRSREEIEAFERFDRICAELLNYAHEMRVKYRRDSTKSWLTFASEKELETWRVMQLEREHAEREAEQYRPKYHLNSAKYRRGRLS